MLKFKPHSPQQVRAIESKAPIILLATGIQFGKTTVGALRMKMAMHEFNDKEDNFLVCSPTYKILSQSTLPPFLRFMEGYGHYNKQDAVFEMYNGGRCYFRTGQDPNSVVGITNVRFIYGDEAGMYSLLFWENIQARAAFKQATTIITTSPYTLNWVYKDLIRPKLKDATARPDVEYIKAKSTDNPYFPLDYYERMRETMEPRRFNMMFGGEWEKAEGLVYNCFDEHENMCNPVDLPYGTKIVAGVDWGTTNPFALIVRAITPDGNHYQLSEVYQTGLTILDMIAVAKQKLLYYPIEVFYADPASPGYIAEFNRAGLTTVAANNDIKMGIDYHYELLKTRRLKMFRGDNKYTLDEYETYHYPSLDEIKQDNDIKEQNPVKQNDHAMDANRYITIMTYTGFHRDNPDIIEATSANKKKMTIEERMARIRTPSREIYEDY